jgi:hypothetical protein
MKFKMSIVFMYLLFLFLTFGIILPGIISSNAIPISLGLFLMAILGLIWSILLERPIKTFLLFIENKINRKQKMSESKKITCDNCDQDLTYTGNSVDYRLKLMDEPMSIEPGISMVTDMMRYPSLKNGSRHFCGLGCLKKWVDVRL